MFTSGTSAITLVRRLNHGATLVQAVASYRRPTFLNIFLSITICYAEPGSLLSYRVRAEPNGTLGRRRNPYLGLRLLRSLRLAGTVEGDGLANERPEGGLVHFFAFVDIDRAAYVPIETRVEESRRILQRRTLGEGQLDHPLVGFACADDALVRPHRSAHPLPLLEDVRDCFLDKLAHSGKGLPAPVPEFGNSL